MVDYWLDDPYDTTLVALQVGQWALDLAKHEDGHSKVLTTTLLGTLYRPVVGTGKKNSVEVRLRVDAWHAKQITNKLASVVGRTLGKGAVLHFHSALEMF